MSLDGVDVSSLLSTLRGEVDVMTIAVSTIFSKVCLLQDSAAISFGSKDLDDIQLNCAVLKSSLASLRSISVIDKNSGQSEKLPRGDSHFGNHSMPDISLFALAQSALVENFMLLKQDFQDKFNNISSAIGAFRTPSSSSESVSSCEHELNRTQWAVLPPTASASRKVRLRKKKPDLRKTVPHPQSHSPVVEIPSPVSVQHSDPLRTYAQVVSRHSMESSDPRPPSASHGGPPMPRARPPAVRGSSQVSRVPLANSVAFNTERVVLNNVAPDAPLSLLVDALVQTGLQVIECGRWTLRDGRKSRGIFVRIAKVEGKDFLDPSFWPDGVYVRSFRGPNPPLLDPVKPRIDSLLHG